MASCAIEAGLYDANDPWSQRFVAKSKVMTTRYVQLDTICLVLTIWLTAALQAGEHFFHYDAQAELETLAGKIFVQVLHFEIYCCHTLHTQWLSK
jgi:hypothetical protein